MLRTLLASFGLATLAAALYVGLGHTEEKKAARAPYVHTVIFTVKKDAPANAAAQLITDAHELLAKIPSVRELRVGRPAEMATPRLARKDYTVGLVILFDNYQGLKTYDEHPLHTKYVERNIKNVELDKLLVFDFENAAK